MSGRIATTLNLQAECQYIQVLGQGRVIQFSNVKCLHAVSGQQWQDAQALAKQKHKHKRLVAETDTTESLRKQKQNHVLVELGQNGLQLQILVFQLVSQLHKLKLLVAQQIKLDQSPKQIQKLAQVMNGKGGSQQATLAFKMPLPAKLAAKVKQPLVRQTKAVQLFQQEQVPAQIRMGHQFGVVGKLKTIAHGIRQVALLALMKEQKVVDYIFPVKKFIKVIIPVQTHMDRRYLAVGL